EHHQGHPDGVRRRLRRQDPRAVRADHRGARARHRTSGSLRDDAAGGAGGGETGRPRHHPSGVRRGAGRPAEGGRGPARQPGRRGRDGHRVRRVLRRRARGQQRVPGEPVSVARVRGTRFRGAHAQAEHRGLPRAGGAPHDLRDRFAHGADRARARAGPRRVSAPASAVRRQADAKQPARPEQRGHRGAPAHRRPSALEERAQWKASGKNGRLRGTGLALGGWLGGLQPTGATVRLNPDGSLQVLTGQVDIAGTNIALAQIAASAYGVDIDKVKITTGDTDVAPVNGLSAGSKTVYTVGVAVMEAAKDARKQTLEIAAKEMEAAVQDLEIENERVVVRGVPDRGVTLAQIGKKGNLYMSK